MARYGLAIRANVPSVTLSGADRAVSLPLANRDASRGLLVALKTGLVMQKGPKDREAVTDDERIKVMFPTCATDIILGGIY